MKRFIRISLAIITFFCLTACSFLQKKFSGTIAYEISYPDKDTTSGFFLTLPKRADYTVNKNFLRMDVYNLDYCISVLFDARKQLMTYMYKGFTDTCYAVRLAQADYKKYHDIIPPYIEVKTGETKEIAGISTQKAILTFSGKEKNFTENIYFIPGYRNKAINALTIFADVSKPLLQFQNHEGFLISAYTAKKVEIKKIESGYFEIPPEYKIVTREEITPILEKYWAAKENGAQ